MNLQTGVVKHRSYPQGPTTPILHRKETFLAPGDERIPAWAALTRSLEDLGLFRETASIGTRRKWDARLASEDVQVLPDHTVRRGPRGRTNPSRGASRRHSRRGPAYGAPRWNPAVEPARAYSPGTSIKQIPALHKALAGAGVLRPGSVNADIGGGRFDDATTFLADHGVTSLVYDPGNRSEAWNRRVLEQVEDGRADSATIANVLNVIPDPGVRAAVLRLAANVVRPGGPVFVGVYEGDGKGNGRETSKGWQENRKLASYLPEVLAVFPDASIRTLGGLRMIVANDGGAVARAPRRASRGAHRAAARSNPRGHRAHHGHHRHHGYRRPGRGRANPFSPADVALLGANVAAVGGIAYSFALDKKSKVLDRAVLRETDRAGILRDTHLDRGPEGRKYVSTPDLKALADPHVYTRAWDARKRELLEQLRTGDYEIRRTGEHQWYFTRPGEARGVHGPATAHGAHGAHGLPSGAQYPGLPAPSIYTDDLHGAHGTHGAREHAAVRSNPRATQRTTPRTTTSSRFDALVQEFERRGVRSPRGLAASIGRRKYGAKRFAAMGAAGRANRRAKARGKQGK